MREGSPGMRRDADVIFVLSEPPGRMPARVGGGVGSASVL